MMPWIRRLVAPLLLAVAPLVQALTVSPYSAEALAAAQQAGKPVAVHFHADWCPTCKQQEKASCWWPTTTRKRICAAR